MNKKSQAFPYRDYQRDALQVNQALQRSRLWVYFVLAAILITPCLSYWFYLNSAKQQINEQFETHAKLLSTVIIKSIDNNAHANLPATGFENSAYTEMTETLQAFLDADPALENISTLLLVGDEIHVILDTSMRSAFMQTLAPQSVGELELLSAIKQNHSWYENLASNEASLAKACSPFPSIRSSYPGMLCLTLNTAELDASLASLSRTNALVALITFLISLTVVASIIQHRKQFILSLELIQKQRDLFLNSSLTDPLTGALNRRAFHLAYASAQSQLQRNDLPFAILSLDIDHFKEINDTYGHDRGDQVLASLVKAMQEILRSSDHLARLGGEEFCIICNIPDLESAVRMAEKLLQSIREIKIQTPSMGELSITSSIGIHIPSQGESMKSALKCADLALYAAKHAGRNQAQVYKES